MMKRFLLAPLGMLLLTGCYHVTDEDTAERQAYIPVYAATATVRQVSFAPPQPIKHAGKIVLYNNLLFQVEQDSGIHVFNISNPASPQRVGYIRSPLCKELAVKNGYLITNNLDDMVVIDITNASAIKEVKRLPGEFPEMTLQYPPQTGVYFQCPDPAKGIVVGWTLGRVKNPQCSR
jgi:hypothetical protein